MPGFRYMIYFRFDGMKLSDFLISFMYEIFEKHSTFRLNISLVTSTKISSLANLS